MLVCKVLHANSQGLYQKIRAGKLCSEAGERKVLVAKRKLDNANTAHLEKPVQITPSALGISG